MTETLKLATTIVSLIAFAGVAVAAIAYLYTLVRKGGVEASDDSNDILRKLNDDLKLEMKEMQRRHDRELTELRTTHEKQSTAMQTQINALEVQIQSLKEANQVLQNTVTGKEILEKIQETLAPVPGLFAPDGVLAEFAKKDIEILDELKYIREAVKPKRAEK